jgi:hypothetical protein
MMMRREVLFTEVAGTMATFQDYWSGQVTAKWEEFGQGQVEAVSLSTTSADGQVLYSAVTLILVPHDEDSRAR